MQPENVLAQLFVGDWLLLQNNPAAAIPTWSKRASWNLTTQ